MKHVVLLGDSIFDNQAYVNGGPDVITQLNAILPQDWKATLLAIDGNITTDVISAMIADVLTGGAHFARAIDLPNLKAKF